MERFQVLEAGCVDEQLKYITEFDISQLISNTKAAVDKAFIPSAINISSDKFANMVSKTYATLEDLYIDKESLEDFFSEIFNTNVLTRIPTTITIFDLSEIDKIRPQYLYDFVSMVKSNVDKFIGSGQTANDIEHTFSNNFMEILKRQLVKTTLPANMLPKDLLTHESRITVQVTKEFVRSSIIQFIKSYPVLKKELTNIKDDVVGTVNNCTDEFNTVLASANQILSNQELDQKERRKLSVFVYAAANSYLSAVSYISMMTIRKINMLVYNIRAYEKLHIVIEGYHPGVRELSANSNINLTESVADMELYNLRTDEVSNELFAGRFDILKVLKTKIADYYKTTLSNCSTEFGDKLHSSIDTIIQSKDYDNQPYIDINDILNDIRETIAIIEKKSQDEFIVIEDITESGLVLDNLLKHYADIFVRIKNIELYDDMEGSEKVLSVLAELECFDTNMNIVTSQFQVTTDSVIELLNSIRGNINNKYPNKTIRVELIELLEHFIREIKSAGIQFSESILNRLKSLMFLLEDESDLPELTAIYSTDVVSNDKPKEVNFMEMVLNAEQQELTTYVESMCTEIMRNYQIEKMYTERGIIPIFEADEPKTDKPATGASTMVDKGNDGAEPTSTDKKPSAVAAKITSITEFIKTLIEKFKAFIQSAAFKGRIETYKKMKEYVASRSYVNVSVSLVPWEEVMPYTRFLKDLKTLKSNISTYMKPGNLSGKSEKDVYTQVFSFLPGVSNTENVRDLMSLYNTGCKEVQPKVYAHGALDSYVKTKMIPFCDATIGDNSHYNQLMTEIEDVGKALEFVTKPVTESVIFEEADGPNSVSVNVNTVASTIRFFLGVVLNCYRDRMNTYYSVLLKAVPANKKAELLIGKEPTPDKPEEQKQEP